MNDHHSTLDITEVQQRLHAFADERNWHRFHDPKSLAMSVAIEAAELMECFQWKTAEESFALGNEHEDKAAISEEIADVAIYLLMLAGKLGIDVPTAIQHKIAANATRYQS